MEGQHPEQAKLARAEPGAAAAKRLDEVDGLRAVAVLAVLVYHFEKSVLPLGYLGVDVFFAISGFVITKSIADDLDRGAFGMGRFMLRRAKRLLPALAVTIAVSTLAGAALMPGRSQFATAATAAAGVSNIWLWYSGSDYFGTATEWLPLTHTWSLGVEEQFYLLFPLVLALLHARKRPALLPLLVLAGLSALLYFSSWGSHRMAAFYLAPFRFWELLAGSVVFQLHQRWRSAPTGPVLHGLVAAILASLVVLLGSGDVPEHVATACSVLATCGVLLLSGRSASSTSLLGSKPFVFIGRISYSLYLWHWPVAVFGKVLVPEHLSLVAYVSATGVLSLASYYLVERPLRTSAWRWSGGRFAVAYPAYLAAMVAVLGCLWLARGRLYLGPAELQEAPALSGSACHIPNSSGLVRCLPAAEDGGKTIWLVGDSHAGNLAGGLRAAAQATGTRFQFLTGASLFLSLQGRCSPAACPEGDHLSLAHHLGRVSRPGDAIFIGFARDRFESGRVDGPQFARNLSALVELLGPADRSIFLVEDIPKVCAGQREFFQSTLGWATCAVSSEQSRRGRAPLSAIYQEVERRSRVTILDPHDELCEQDGVSGLRCSNFLGGRAIYLDPSPHLTAGASASLERFFVASLEQSRSGARSGRAGE